MRQTISANSFVCSWSYRSRRAWCRASVEPGLMWALTETCYTGLTHVLLQLNFGTLMVLLYGRNEEMLFCGGGTSYLSACVCVCVLFSVMKITWRYFLCNADNSKGSALTRWKWDTAHVWTIFARSYHLKSVTCLIFMHPLLNIWEQQWANPHFIRTRKNGDKHACSNCAL
jgi:hypothetical protein